ncbi:nucleotide exchange factor GrpE [Aestuariimicrobium soli]|uniref:nucleotide exchange factor GrpE n=1 Tax=Aestuariimicrobium soli TaxID=2035834 RepID=UPI003EB96D1C
MSEENRPEGDIAAEAEQYLIQQEASQTEGEVTDEAAGEPAPSREQELETLVRERTADLQRLQAEYVNYKKRVDRDRAHARQAGVESVVQELLPVLDSIEMARQHDDLGGGFKLVADELEKVAGKHGLSSFGAVGDAFDPQHHDALMQVPMDEAIEVTTVSQVMQRGYSLHGRVIRPARVAVAEPN